MTAEWYDLAQRLYAKQHRCVVPRLAAAPVVAARHPVAVRATMEDESAVHITACAPGHAPESAAGHDALDLLDQLGVSVASDSPRTLITDDPATLGVLHRLALSCSHNGPQEATAAHIGWWRERADFPTGRAVVDLPAACRTRWVIGTAPADETNPTIWRHWLGVPDESVAGLMTLYEHLTTGSALRWLDLLAEDDVWAYGYVQREHADGWDWRRKDSTGRAAIGLRARCDAADVYAASLLTDPLFRRRAVHTGHVVTGRAHPHKKHPRRLTVTCTRMDGRLRPGTEVTGWAGGVMTTTAQTFSATVTSATVRSGRLTLTLDGATGHRPRGGVVTLIPAAPSLSRQRAARSNYRALYNSRRSWLTTGRTPTATRREVPLDVLVAGAEPAD